MVFITIGIKNEKFADKKFGDERQIGFSAQELESIYPEMVKTDVNGYKTVDYSKFTPVLVEAIKEQQTTIEELKKITRFRKYILKSKDYRLAHYNFVQKIRRE